MPSNRRRSTKGRDSLGTQIQYNDDDAEKEENRRSSAHHNARRHSIKMVARETLKGGNAQQQRDNAPLLANFEQWMKLVKDNKINATNSWNFALIDYFHDMSLLKEGDGINFQKASYTLDGCVKIYTSRVDSVASETGKLLSGLAESGNKDAFEDADEDQEGSDGEQETQKKTRKRKKHAESTLASSFEQLRVKKLDLELSIDPLFRKMCADFDEGGAKGLLLNSLTIDREGRVVFDGEADYDSDDDEEEKDKEDEEKPEDMDEVKPSIDIERLKNEYFGGVDIDELSVCPSMANIQNALNDPSLATSMKDIEGREEEPEQPNLDNNNMEMNPEYDYDDGGDDIGDMGAFDGMDVDDGLTFGEPNGTQLGDISSSYVQNYALNATAGNHDQTIMSYFDETLKKNWAGPEHWKVQKLKQSSLLSSDEPVKKRAPAKEKEPFTIDFMSEENEVDETVIFQESGTTINIPKSQWKSKTRNLLPDDKHFTSKNLIKLFNKPMTKMAFGMFGSAVPVGEDEDVDEHFWANQYQKQNNGPDQTVVAGDYDANFFQEDGGDDIGDGGFDDGGGFDMDMEMPEIPESAEPEPDDLKGQLLMAGRRARPEYVNYAKTAKRVNVRLLKDNIWNALKWDHESKENDNEATPGPEDEPEEQKQPVPDERKFTEVVQDLKSAYNTQQMSEISTSFCFICVLHLANEKGLVIDGNQDYSDLTIRRDPDAPSLDEEAIA